MRFDILVFVLLRSARLTAELLELLELLATSPCSGRRRILGADAETSAALAASVAATPHSSLRIARLGRGARRSHSEVRAANRVRDRRCRTRLPRADR